MRIIVFILIIFLSNIVLSQTVETDIEELGLIGKVKSVYEKYFTIKNNGDTIEDLWKFHYNKEGFETNVYHFEKDSLKKWVNIEKKNYNDEGRLVESISYGVYDNPIIWVLFLYDGDRLISENRKSWYEKDESRNYKIENLYKDSLEVGYLKYNRKGKILKKVDYTFDNEGRIIFANHYSKKGKIIYKDYKKYNDLGFIHEMKIYSDDKEFYKLYKSFYNDKGQLIKSTVSYSGKTINIYNYIYDELGLISKYEIDYDSPVSKTKTISEFNEFGDIVKETKINFKVKKKEVFEYEGKEYKRERMPQPPSIKTFKYVYEEGNWIEQRIYAENQLEVIVKREIEYYP